VLEVDVLAARSFAARTSGRVARHTGVNRAHVAPLAATANDIGGVKSCRSRRPRSKRSGHGFALLRGEHPANRVEIRRPAADGARAAPDGS
jgi:hypothetical protein